MGIPRIRTGNRAVTYSAVLVTSALLNVSAPLEAAAQPGSSGDKPTSAPVASSFADLVGHVSPGARIRVTEVSGRTVQGTIGLLSASSLEMGHDAGATPRVLPEGDVQSIELVLRDSLWNGTLIGLGIGVLAGMVTAHGDIQDIAFLCGIGAGVGALADVAVHGGITIYQAPIRRPSGVRLSPVLSKSAVGVAASLRF